MGDSTRCQKTLDTFPSRLRRWKLSAACRRQCIDLSRPCTCPLQFVHVAKFEEWIQSKDTDDSTMVIDRLLGDLHPMMKGRRTIPFQSQTILEGQNRCVVVFGILLSLGHGELIDFFHAAKVVDRYLYLSTTNMFSDSLCDAFVNKNAFKLNDVAKTRQRAQEIIADFEKAKWAFCNPRFTLYMDENLDFKDSKFILPFCRHIAVNAKGGTATVFQVAVKKDLITDKPLAKALDKSLYEDPDYGPCYRMAVKSYKEKTKDIFEWEKEAFSALRGDEKIPIVHCLGSYSHDDGDGKTYNLLLEYGEMDLDEYCADLGNVAPVRSEEIIRFWKSLFEVAKAIERVHQVPIRQGRTWRMYNGWHADIKPDNILMVHGRFKLADFGFAKFAETVEDDKPPEQFVMGGTDTYGAPEFARAKRSETQSPVKQTIDTWSFGCVLSIAATWIVLGFQGIQQFQFLRKIANSNLQKGNKRPTDRFHDGREVLREITQWHRYLSDHVRTADTITPRVLKLINNDMLKAHPDERLTSAKLCEELEELLERAEASRQKKLQSGDLHKTDVLVALLAAEKAAHSESEASRTSPRPQAAPLQLDIASPDGHHTLRVTFDVPVSQSKRVGKEKKMQSLPMARTPYREQILEEELGEQYKISTVHQRPDPTLVHHEGHERSTEGPVQMTRPLQEGWGRFENHTDILNHSPTENTQGLNLVGIRTSDPTPTIVSSPDHGQSPFMPDHVPRIKAPSPSNPLRHGLVESEGSTNNRQHSDPVHINSTSQSIHESPESLKTTSEPAMRNAVDEAPSGRAEKRHHQHREYSLESPSPAQMNGSLDNLPMSALPILPRKSETGAPSASSSRFDDYSYGLHQERNIGSVVPNSPVQTSPPPIIITSQGGHNNMDNYQNLNPPPTASYVDSSGRGNESVVNSEMAQSYQTPVNSRIYTFPPPTIGQLPWDVCRVRLALDNKETKSTLQSITAATKSFLGKEDREKDTHLATFIHNRELIFVIDNGTTMLEHWPIQHFVAETLLRKVAGLDKSGIDIRFTINGHLHNRNNLRGESGRRELKKALNDARPIPLRGEHFLATNMDQILRDIFREWHDREKINRKATTVIVLTDGVWKGTYPQNAINHTLVRFADEVQADTSFGSRHFSIGFVRFGEAGKERLRFLDDELCAMNELDDIIDHCSWTDTVYKMLLGSLDAYQDQKNAGENDVLYEPSALSSLFDMFNYRALHHPNSLNMQPPNPGLSRSPSRGSNRSSSFDFQRQGTEKSLHSTMSVPASGKRKKRFSFLP